MIAPSATRPLLTSCTTSAPSAPPSTFRGAHFDPLEFESRWSDSLEAHVRSGAEIVSPCGITGHDERIDAIIVAAPSRGSGSPGRRTPRTTCAPEITYPSFFGSATVRGRRGSEIGPGLEDRERSGVELARRRRAAGTSSSDPRSHGRRSRSRTARGPVAASASAASPKREFLEQDRIGDRRPILAALHRMPRGSACSSDPGPRPSARKSSGMDEPRRIRERSGASHPLRTRASRLAPAAALRTSQMKSRLLLRDCAARVVRPGRAIAPAASRVDVASGDGSSSVRAIWWKILVHGVRAAVLGAASPRFDRHPWRRGGRAPPRTRPWRRRRVPDVRVVGEVVADLAATVVDLDTSTRHRPRRSGGSRRSTFADRAPCPRAAGIGSDSRTESAEVSVNRLVSMSQTLMPSSHPPARDRRDDRFEGAPLAVRRGRANGPSVAHRLDEAVVAIS